MNMKCEVIRDLLPLYVDGVASEESRALIEEHLKTCEGCREYCRLLRKIRRRYQWQSMLMRPPR